MFSVAGVADEEVSAFRSNHNANQEPHYRYFKSKARAMKPCTVEDWQVENERVVRALQYTIAQRERLKVLLRMIGIVTSQDGGVTASEIIDLIFESQAEHSQDAFALMFSGCKRNGFFVEFGACDGVVLNNTVNLERRFGWKGILAEPARIWRDSLPLNRIASIDTRCVSAVSGREVEFFESDRPGNSSSHKDHQYIGKITNSYVVETVSLMDLLSHHSAPSFIDYLSVDTEGHEKEVLSTFDFDKYRFGFITIEEHEGVSAENSVQPLLEQAGYEVIIPREEGRPVPMAVSGVDKFFVPAGHPATRWILG